MKLRCWCKNNSSCAIWICQWIIVWCAMLEHYRIQMPKLTNIMLSWMSVLSTIRNNLLHGAMVSFFSTDFDRGLLQLVGIDIVNTLFKYWVSYRHLIFIIKTFELLMKSYEKFDSLFVNIQCAICSLEKVNFKLSTAVSVEPYKLF